MLTGAAPSSPRAMSRLLHWVTMTATARYHAHYHTAGTGHLYQGRFKSFPIQSDEHFFVACRYVDRNALASSPPRKTGGSEVCTTAPVDDAASN